MITKCDSNGCSISRCGVWDWMLDAWLNALIDQMFRDWPSLLQNPLGLYIVSMVVVVGMIGVTFYKAVEKHD